MLIFKINLHLKLNNNDLKIINLMLDSTCSGACTVKL